VAQVLAWADAYHAAHGIWPAVRVGARDESEPVAGAPGESWAAINRALALGLRGLPGDSSLAELLAEHRGAPAPEMGAGVLARKIWAWEQEQFPVKGPRLRLRRRPKLTVRLTINKVLGWAEAHRARTGKWPRSRSGPVPDVPYEITWSIINNSLYMGWYGLPGGSSVRRLLAEHRGVRLPLTVERILAWADAYHAAHGCWPSRDCKHQEAAPGVTWCGIDSALRQGSRGLSGGTSLTRLLVEHRGPEASRLPPRLSVEQILAWADAHHAATGLWPCRSTGAVAGSPGDTWVKLELALRQGHRGLQGGTSLARLLAEHRGARNRSDLPGLTVEQILAWAEAHHAATGRWPTPLHGAIAAAPGENWRGVQSALYLGYRGLPGGITLPQLLADRKPPPKPPLTLATIRSWAEGHGKATGYWPDRGSGPVAGVPGESWDMIDKALRLGRRGLPGGMTLTRAIGWRPKPMIRREPELLTIERILAWADAHHAATGRWPTAYSGPIAGAPGQRWLEIDHALKGGSRGLPRGLSVAKLIAQRRRDTQGPAPLPETRRL
jgi:hypothetical protein